MFLQIYRPTWIKVQNSRKNYKCSTVYFEALGGFYVC